MLNEIRGAEDSVALKLYSDEIGLIVSVFWDLSLINESLGSVRPEGVSDEDVRVAEDLVKSVRTHWVGTDDERTLYGVVDNLIDLYPELIPWVQGFLEDGFQGGMRLFDLVAYAHNTVFQ